MTGNYAKTIFIVTAVILIALSIVDGAMNGASPSNYVVILTSFFVLVCSAFIRIKSKP